VLLLSPVILLLIQQNRIKKSILFTSNDKTKETGKIVLTANVIPFNVKRDTKNISLIPFTVAVPGYGALTDVVYKSFSAEAEKRYGMPFISSHDLAKGIASDPQYGKEDITPIVRKWAGTLGIRYTVIGELSVRGQDTTLILVFIDALLSIL
jgi:hypothetical protein